MISARNDFCMAELQQVMNQLRIIVDGVKDGVAHNQVCQIERPLESASLHPVPPVACHQSGTALATFLTRTRRSTCMQVLLTNRDIA